MPTRRVMGPYEQSVFHRQVACKEGRSTHINILELKTVWLACQRFEELVKGKAVSFQIDNTTAVAYQLKEGGTTSRP